MRASRVFRLGRAGACADRVTVFATAHVQEYRVRPYLHDKLYLPSGKFVEQTSLGYKQLVADLIWFQAVQYFGGYAQERAQSRLLRWTDRHRHRPRSALRLSVRVRRHGDVTRHGSTSTRHRDHSRRACVPIRESGNFRSRSAFSTYITRARLRLAARYFDLAVAHAGRAGTARGASPRSCTRARARETSIRMWEELEETTEEPYMRDMADRYLEQAPTTRAEREAGMTVYEWYTRWSRSYSAR